MSFRLYRFEVSDEIGRDGATVIYNAVDSADGSTLRLYQWTPPELSIAVEALVSLMSRLAGVEVFERTAHLYLAATEAQAKQALDILRQHQLFPGKVASQADRPQIRGKPEPLPRPHLTGRHIAWISVSAAVVVLAIIGLYRLVSARPGEITVRTERVTDAPAQNTSLATPPFIKALPPSIPSAPPASSAKASGSPNRGIITKPPRIHDTHGISDGVQTDNRTTPPAPVSTSFGREPRSGDSVPFIQPSAPEAAREPAARVEAPAPPPPPLSPKPTISSAPVVEPSSPAPSVRSLFPSPPAAYSGPRSGHLLWTGDVEKGGVITINGTDASPGSVNSGLPGVPVNIDLDTKHFAIVEFPSTANGWKKLRIRSKDKRNAIILKWEVSQ